MHPIVLKLRIFIPLEYRQSVTQVFKQKQIYTVNISIEVKRMNYSKLFHLHLDLVSARPTSFCHEIAFTGLVIQAMVYIQRIKQIIQVPVFARTACLSDKTSKFLNCPANFVTLPDSMSDEKL